LATAQVALAKKDRCADALAFCGDDASLADIKGYCQYRLGDLEGALETARNNAGGGHPEAAAHVEAQTLYKRGDFAGAAEIYRGLLENDTKRSTADRRELEANYYAASCQAGLGRAAAAYLEAPAEPEAHYELASGRRRRKTTPRRRVAATPRVPRRSSEGTNRGDAAGADADRPRGVRRGSSERRALNPAANAQVQPRPLRIGRR